jgi:PAS domain S-box-containing protein
MPSSPDDLTLRHLARVVDSSDDAIVSKDLNGTILTWNPAAERIFGYRAEEVIGRSIRIIIPADRQSEEDLVLAHIRAGKAVSHYDTIRQRKDGTFVPITLTVSPIFDDEGRIIGASKIARDISDRVRADSATRRLAAVVESSDDAIVTKDLNSVITSWNPAAERMFGYTAQEAIGRSIRMIIPEELQAEEDLVLSKIRIGEKVDHYETTRQRKDGRKVRISLTVSPIYDNNGKIIGASKIARDITLQTRLRTLTDEHTANLATLGQVGAMVVSTLDRQTVVEKVTDLATQLTNAQFGAFFYNVKDPESGDSFMLYSLSGAPRDAFSRFPHPRATEIFGPTFRGEAVVRLDDVTADPRYGHNPPYFGMPEGHLPVHSYLAVPVKGHGDEVLGGLFFGHSAVGVFTEHHEQLAVGVAAWASVGLENARLYAEAQQANRLKDEFLAVLSHELRTPLNAIVGYSRLLRNGLLTADKTTRAIEVLDRNASALSQIVEDVLDVSRIIGGKLRLHVQPVDLAAVVESAVATVQPAADARQVRVQVITDKYAGPVSGDPDRLQQVVWNLVSNAVKFTPRGGRVHVRVERVNSHVEIVVSDTGIGISPAFLPYVFERFRQADSGISRRSGGLGLGLAIVRHLVEMHGGTVDATSPGENMGSTFRVRLPLMIVHHEIADRNRVHPIAERRDSLAPLDDLRGVHVLAVDDDADALLLLRTVLEIVGGRVTACSSARAALEKIDSVRPDVLVADVGMPDMDGFELIGQIRASSNPVVRGVPAAALTAYARSEDRQKALRAGFQLHMSKPIDPAELVTAVSALARRSDLTPRDAPREAE